MHAAKILVVTRLRKVVQMASFWYTGQFFIYGSSKFVKSAWEDASKNFTEDLSKVFTLFLGLLWDSGFLVPEK